MAGRGSCAASDSVTGPLLRDGGTKALLGVKVLEEAADMMQNVENMSPQTLAPKARKRVSGALQSVHAGLSGIFSLLFSLLPQLVDVGRVRIFGKVLKIEITAFLKLSHAHRTPGGRRGQGAIMDPGLPHHECSV